MGKTFGNAVRAVVVILVAATTLLDLGHAEGATLSPDNFASLGPLPGGSFVIDTDALTFGGNSGGVLQSQTGGPDIAVFTFDGDATLNSGDTITIVGSRPAALLFQGSFLIMGTILADGSDGLDGRDIVGGPGGAAGPGGFAGGAGDDPCSAPERGENGFGPGGGVGGTSTGSVFEGGLGGGGGGFGGPGGKGGGFAGTGGDGGIATSNTPVILEGGSGGGGGGAFCGAATGGGGGGGGAGGGLEIGAKTRLVSFGGTIRANGGDGGGNAGFDGGGGGGGAGGGVFLHGYDVILDANTTIRALGGSGGSAGTTNGGGGGGGHIAILNNTGGQLVNRTSLGLISAGNGPVDFLTDPNVGMPSASPVSVVPLSPGSFASLGTLPNASFTIDTDALTYNGTPGGVVVAQSPTLTPIEIAVFAFDGGAVLDPGNTIDVVGSRAVALLFQGSAVIRGTINANGSNGQDPPVASRGLGGAGGPGGFAGGRGSGCEPSGFNGNFIGGGNGGGSSATVSGTGSGGGGGYGSEGGGGANPLAGGDGGIVYGDLAFALEGGSGGGGGGAQCSVSLNGGGGGGGGGGAVEIGAETTLEFLGGVVNANGGNGGNGIGDGGGGSGGGILLHAYQVHFDTNARLRANGGAPNGGGGRIQAITNADGVLTNWTVPGYTAGSTLIRGDLSALGRGPSGDGPIDLVTDPAVGTGPARAGLPLNPDAYPSLGQFPAGSFTLDTSDLTVDGQPGGVVQPQFDGPAIAVFVFDGGNVGSVGDTITIVGGRPAALLFQGPTTIAGSIIAGGQDGSSPVLGGAPGPGGGRGGRGSSNCSIIEYGGGPGGGGAGRDSTSKSFARPGDGGSFGGNGSDVNSNPGGLKYSDIRNVLEGGSGGGGGGNRLCNRGNVGGGAGGSGGTVEIGAIGQLSLAEASVQADGGNGAVNGGGGSGGGIFLHGFSIDLDANSSLSARGGNGAGGGGGGHIVVCTNTGGQLTDNTVPGAINVNGGASGGEMGIIEIDCAEADLGLALNNPPTAEAGGPYDVGEGSTVQLHGTGSTDAEQPGNTLIFEWDLDDDGVFGETGAAAQQGAEVGSSPTYSAGGLDGPTTAQVVLRVTDDEGESDTDPATITIRNVSPTVDLSGPDQADEGETHAYSFASTDPAMETFSLDSANCGTGGALSNSSFDSASGSGSFDCTFVDGDDTTDVSVSVSDDDGGVGQDSLTVMVNNVAPTVDAGPDQEIKLSETANLTASFTDPGVNDTHNSLIDWRDLVVEPGVVTQGAGSGTVAGGHPYSLTGQYTVEVCVTDNDGGEGCDSLLVTVVPDNSPPVADAGADRTIVRNTSIQVEGTWSDPEGSKDDPYTWSWDLDGDRIPDSSGSASFGDVIRESVSFALEGQYILTFAVTDRQKASDEDSVEILVLNQAPNCSAAAPSVEIIWPPNHKMVPVSILGVEDPDGDAFNVTIDSIFQDEPVNATSDGNFEPDGRGVGTGAAEVRAERAGDKKIPGNGRVYHIGFTADDGRGGVCSGEVLVGVPHDQGQGSEPVDDGPLFDSTIP